MCVCVCVCVRAGVYLFLVPQNPKEQENINQH